MSPVHSICRLLLVVLLVVAGIIACLNTWLGVVTFGLGGVGYYPLYLALAFPVYVLNIISIRTATIASAIFGVSYALILYLTDRLHPKDFSYAEWGSFASVGLQLIAYGCAGCRRMMPRSGSEVQSDPHSRQIIP